MTQDQSANCRKGGSGGEWWRGDRATGKLATIGLLVTVARIRVMKG